MANFNLYSRGDRIFGWANAILLGLFVLSTLYPFIYVLSVSLSSGAAVTAGRVTLWPVDVTLAAYDRVLSDRMFWVAYGNTFIYTFGGTLMSLLIMIPGAYALSRKRLRGRTFFNIAIAFTLWFNAGMIPFFLNMRDLGLLDSRFGIILGFAANAFNVILLRNFSKRCRNPSKRPRRWMAPANCSCFGRCSFRCRSPQSSRSRCSASYRAGTVISGPWCCCAARRKFRFRSI